MASVMVANDAHTGLPRGRWPSEKMPCKLDGILHYKSNSSPEGVYLPAGITRTRNFCEFCTTVIPVPGSSVRSARPCQMPGVRVQTAFLYLRGTSVSSVRPCYNTRNFWKFCKTFIPVPGTSVSSVGHSYPYPELL